MNANARRGFAVQMCAEAAERPRLRAVAHVRAAYAHLDDIARNTDEPDPRDVDAADRLAEAADLLARMAPP